MKLKDRLLQVAECLERRTGIPHLASGLSEHRWLNRDKDLGLAEVDAALFRGTVVTMCRLGLEAGIANIPVSGDLTDEQIATCILLAACSVPSEADIPNAEHMRHCHAHREMLKVMFLLFIDFTGIASGILSPTNEVAPLKCSE